MTWFRTSRRSFVTLVLLLQEHGADAVLDHAHQRCGGHVFRASVPGGDRIPEEIQPSAAARIQHQTDSGSGSVACCCFTNKLNKFFSVQRRD